MWLPVGDQNGLSKAQVLVRLMISEMRSVGLDRRYAQGGVRERDLGSVRRPLWPERVAGDSLMRAAEQVGYPQRGPVVVGHLAAVGSQP